MALVGVELKTLVFEPDAQTNRPPLFVWLLSRRIVRMESTEKAEYL